MISDALSSHHLQRALLCFSSTMQYKMSFHLEQPTCQEFVHLAEEQESSQVKMNLDFKEYNVQPNIQVSRQ
jgi:hypothetical protein